MRDRPSLPDADAGLRAILEALVFAAEEPLGPEDLRELFPDLSPERLAGLLEDVARACEAGDRGLQISRVAGGYRMTTKADLGGWVRALFRSRNRRRLSAAALETLAIIAYRQPVTTPEIQALRGTDPGTVLQNLLEKKLVRIVGRKKVVGKPIVYGTTREFLAHFGLNTLADLPSLEEFGAVASTLPAGPAASPSEVETEDDAASIAPEVPDHEGRAEAQLAPDGNTP